MAHSVLQIRIDFQQPYQEPRQRQLVWISEVYESTRTPLGKESIAIHVGQAY